MDSVMKATQGKMVHAASLLKDRKDVALLPVFRYKSIEASTLSIAHHSLHSHRSFGLFRAILIRRYRSQTHQSGNEGRAYAFDIADRSGIDL